MRRNWPIQKVKEATDMVASAQEENKSAFMSRWLSKRTTDALSTYSDRNGCEVFVKRIFPARFKPIKAMRPACHGRKQPQAASHCRQSMPAPHFISAGRSYHGSPVLSMKGIPISPCRCVVGCCPALERRQRRQQRLGVRPQPVRQQLGHGGSSAKVAATPGLRTLPRTVSFGLLSQPIGWMLTFPRLPVAVKKVTVPSSEFHTRTEPGGTCAPTVTHARCWAGVGTGRWGSWTTSGWVTSGH